MLAKMMEAIDNVASKNKEWIEQVISEIQRDNATNFIALERSIRLKLEVLELRMNSSIEVLRKEVEAQLSIFKNSATQGKCHLHIQCFSRM